MIQSTYEAYTGPDDIAMRIRLNLDFHGRIYRLVGNDDAREMIDKHSSLVRVLTRRAGEIAGPYMREARDELLKALQQRPLAQVI